MKLIDQGITSNRCLAELMAALPAKRRKAVHTAFGYLALISMKIHSSHQRKAVQHA